MADVNPQENPPNGDTVLDVAEKLVEAVPVKDLPAFLFLFTKPNQETPGDGREQNEAFDVAKLKGVFKDALRAKSVEEIRKTLIVLTTSILEGCQATQKTCTIQECLKPTKIGDKDLQVLQMHEILQMFEIDVPQKIRTHFLHIIETSSIPLTNVNGEINQYFVNTGNRVLMKLCNQMTKKEIIELFQIIRNDKNQEFKKGMDKLEQLVELEDSQVEGLEDVFFYYIVLVLRSKDHLNRIHTHTLDKFLEATKACDITDSSVEIQPLDLLRRYPLAPATPGLCVIFNVGELEEETVNVGNNPIYRKGSKQDRIKMKKLFEEEFKYNVLDKVNPTKKDVKTLIGRLDDARYQFFDSLVIVFMSHGNMDELEMIDGKMIKIYDELIQPITEIKWLEKKPKLFFFQACREKLPSTNEKDGHGTATFDSQTGTILQTGSVLNPFVTKNMEGKYGRFVNSVNLNPRSDMLVCYATMCGELAARRESGSPYIDILDEQLRKYGRKENILNVLSRVHYVVNIFDFKKGEFRQAPCCQSSLQKAFIFPPKSGNNPGENKTPRGLAE